MHPQSSSFKQFRPLEKKIPLRNNTFAFCLFCFVITGCVTLVRMSQCAGDWISWDVWVRPACQAAHPRSAVMMPCRWCLPACSPRVQNVLLATQTLLAEPQAINALREDLSTTISLWLLLLLLFIYISILSYAVSEHSGFSLALKLVTINFFVLSFLTVNGDNTNPYLSSLYY